MLKSKPLFLNIVFLISFSSCAKKGSKDAVFALAPGTYLLDGPVCISTGAGPAYKNVSHKINLFDFDTVEQHSLKIEGSSSIRTISDGSCAVEISQPVHANKNGSFSNQISRTVAFDPESCTLPVSIGNETFTVGSQSTEGLQNRDSTNMDLPFIISATETGFDMISADVPVLNDLWGEYGCTTPDRIKWAGRSE